VTHGHGLCEFQQHLATEALVILTTVIITDLRPLVTHSQWNNKPSVSIKVTLELPPPSSSSCTWNLLLHCFLFISFPWHKLILVLLFTISLCRNPGLYFACATTVDAQEILTFGTWRQGTPPGNSVWRHQGQGVTSSEAGVGGGRVSFVHLGSELLRPPIPTTHTVNQGWKKPRFLEKVFRFLDFLGFLDFNVRRPYTKLWPINSRGISHYMIHVLPPAT